MKLIQICVESNKKARTDAIYVDKALKYFYNIGSDVKILYVYLNGKGNYNRQTVLNEIIRNKKQSSADNQVVVYVIDTDNLQDSNVVKENGKITKFCNNKNFDLVWMCENVEEVFLNKTVADKQKVSSEKCFAVKTGLDKANELSLSAVQIRNKKSNLLLIFDQYLERI